MLRAQAGWPTYGGDPGGQRFSTATRINPGNLAHLKIAWTVHTHALETGTPNANRSDFEATPVLFGDALYFTTPFDRVLAVDAQSGSEKWSYDPHLPSNLDAANYTSRGVATWQAARATAGPCDRRVYVATLDARLISLDADTGKACLDFGSNGQVNLRAGTPTQAQHPYQFFGNTSPPTVVGDVVIVGSAVGDNQRVDMEPGTVRGFNARSGALLWTWNALTWALAQKTRTGAGNAWGVLSADPEHSLVYVPTGSPAVDFWGGTRPGNNADANSLVALDARTGQKVWAFQLVHHDLWDYDVASQPLLFTYKGTPAVAIASKVGMLFVLNRLTGQPLVPVIERPVPASDVPGEVASPTQPFTDLPPLSRQTFQPSGLGATSPADIGSCTDLLQGLRYEGVFTPPSLRGTLQFPGSLGGVNWGSMAFDPTTNVLYANTNGSAYEIRLVPQPGSSWRDTFQLRSLTGDERLLLLAGGMLLPALFLLTRRGWPRRSAYVLLFLFTITLALLLQRSRSGPANAHRAFLNSPDSIGETSPNAGAPYRIMRKVLNDHNGLPCTPTPWGKTIAINLKTSRLLWEHPLGTLIASHQTGSVGFGAPILTAGGVLFTGNSQQSFLRALNPLTGEELWSASLPAPAESTPMTYEIAGRQFVVVAAGGHGGLGTPLSDTLVAFALDPTK